MTYGHSNLSWVEFCSLLSKPSAISQVHEQFTSSHESHNEENLLLSLEYVMHSYQEGVISLHKDILLKFSAFDLIVVYNDVLSEWFHSIDIFLALLFNKEDLTEWTTTNDLLNDEILESNFLISSPCIDGLWWFSKAMSLRVLIREITLETTSWSITIWTTIRRTTLLSELDWITWIKHILCT